MGKCSLCGRILLSNSNCYGLFCLKKMCLYTGMDNIKNLKMENNLNNTIQKIANKGKLNKLQKQQLTNRYLTFKMLSEVDIDYYNEIFFSSLKIISALTAILTVILTCLYIWGALTSIRLMVKDFTINLFVGLSYSRLRRIFYGYYGILSLFNLIVLFAITASLRYGSWIRKDAAFSTFGLLGVIGIDWLALLAVLIFNAVIGILIVEIMMWRIKKIPISLGVIQ